MYQEKRPQAVMLSKRVNVFYLEHVKLMQKDERIVYLTEGSHGIDQFVAIPDKNTAFVLLGKGSSITDSAARKFAESSVLVGFCGSGGSPLFGMTDITFLLPQDEYRPTNHAQKWFALWSNENSRLEMGRAFLNYRVNLDRTRYNQLGLEVKTSLFDKFEEDILKCHTITELLAAEGRFAKTLYASLAQIYDISNFKRDAGAKKQDHLEQKVNSFLDHGNYLAYGYAAVALHGMGVPYFLPVLHGKTRRGGLVFDVADLFKDWMIMPLAFKSAVANSKDSEFRAEVIEHALRYKILDDIMEFISKLPDKMQPRTFISV